MKGIIVCTMSFLLVIALHQGCSRPQAKPPSTQVQSSAPAVPTVQSAAGGEQAPQAGPSTQASAGAKVFSGEGVVEEVDKSIDTIQINHGDIKGYMPAMSMPYRVRDKSMLDLVKPGDKINFTLEDSGRGAVLIEIRKTAA